jgi:hypothetical protein
MAVNYPPSFAKEYITIQEFFGEFVFICAHQWRNLRAMVLKGKLD